MPLLPARRRSVFPIADTISAVKRKLLLAASVFLLGIACALLAPSSATGNAAAPTITLTPTPTAAEILSKAGDSVLAMKSARFSILREGESAMINAETGMAFLEASGEYQAPDRARATCKVTLLSAVLEIEMYWLPDGNYMSNPLTGQLMPAPAGLGINIATLFSPEGIPAVLKTGIQNTQRVGDETIEDVPSIHIRGEADGAVLGPLMAGALQSGTLYPVDAWVAKADWNLVRFHIAEPDGSGWLIDLYDINADIQVQLPQA
jgi:hypothetical protein